MNSLGTFSVRTVRSILVYVAKPICGYSHYRLWWAIMLTEYDVARTEPFFNLDTQQTLLRENFVEEKYISFETTRLRTYAKLLWFIKILNAFLYKF